MIFHKLSMEGKPVLVWEISLSPPGDPKAALAELMGWGLQKSE